MTISRSLLALALATVVPLAHAGELPQAPRESKTLISMAVNAALGYGDTETPETPEAAVRRTLASINPQAEIQSVKDALPGWQQVIAQGTVLYVSNDGRYLMHGQLFDTEGRRNLTSVATNELRRETIDELPTEGRIVFKPAGEVKHRVLVFTDTSCGYCSKLHREIDTYLAAGIQIEYMAYPRGGAENPAAKTMDTIWCAKDPNAAFTAAVAGNPSTPAQREKCESPVLEQFAWGSKMGIEGTPAIYALDGEQLGGYVPAEQLLVALNAKASDAAAAGGSR